MFLGKVCKLQSLDISIIKMSEKMQLIKLITMKILLQKVKIRSFGKFNKDNNTVAIL